MTATTDYDIRWVTAGDKTIDEGDDTVLIVSNRSEATGTLIPRDKLKFIVHELGDRKAQEFVTFEPLVARPCMAKYARRLRFRTVAEGFEFYNWMEKSHSLERKTLKTGPQKAKHDREYITITKDNYVLCLYNPDSEQKAPLQRRNSTTFYMGTRVELKQRGQGAGK